MPYPQSFGLGSSNFWQITQSNGTKMDIQFFTRLLTRSIFSLLAAGFTYLLWLGIFLSADLSNNLIEIALTILAPVFTSFGFALSIFIMERLSKERSTKFLLIFLWTLAWCSVGAFVTNLFGPMLIVFGIFIMGALSVVLREVIIYRRGAG